MMKCCTSCFNLRKWRVSKTSVERITDFNNRFEDIVRASNGELPAHTKGEIPREA